MNKSKLVIACALFSCVCAYGAKKKSLPAAVVLSPQQRYESDIKTSDHLYHYSSFDLPDPFSLPAPAGEGMKSPEGLRSSLLAYPLQDFSLVGTWTAEGGHHQALVITPEDEGVIIKNGDHIGTRQGEVVEISDDTLIVRQSIITSAGVRYFEDYQLLLNDE